MNQILETIDKKNKKKIFSTYSKRFKLIFILSLIIIIITLIFLYNNIWKINQDTEISKILSNNYNTLKLYSNPTSNSSEINTNENFIIGKIEIPQSLLTKNGALTKEEWETMRQHSMYNGRMLNQF